MVGGSGPCERDVASSHGDAASCSGGAAGSGAAVRRRPAYADSGWASPDVRHGGNLVPGAVLRVIRRVLHVVQLTGAAWATGHSAQPVRGRCEAGGTIPRCVRPTDMWRSFLLLVGLVGLLAGCSWSSDQASSSRSGWMAYPMGTVDGRVVVRGGVQFPHAKKPRPATNTPFTFVAVPASGRMIVRHVKTDAHGRFRLRLPPGRYSVGGTFTESEPLAEAAKEVLVVAVGRVVRVRLTEAVR
jgi:hypothetical protein